MTREWEVNSETTIRIRSVASACVPRYIHLEFFEGGQKGSTPIFAAHLTRDESKQIISALQNGI
jgi:hypothetical protein